MKIKINKTSEVSNLKVTNFLKNIFINRDFKIYKIWNWLYKTDIEQAESSLVAIKDEEIIAHAGLIPTEINFNGKKRKAAWFVDFIVDLKLQNQGIGKMLTKRWLNYSEIGLTFCNEKSFGVFKKFGWQEGFQFHLHYFLIRPFNHQKIYLKFKYFKFVLFLLNYIYSNIFILIIKLKIDKKNKLIFEKINSENIKKFTNTDLKKNLINTYRDQNYLLWRFLKSPESNNYLFVTYKGKYNAIIKKRTEKKFCKYLDLLIVNKYQEDNDFIQLILNIIIWANKNKLSYIKMIISDKNISNFLKKNIFNISTKPKFAYFSKNNEELEEIKNSNFSFQLFDTDFEFSN